jgi:DNA-binding NarL/FixJ family response regulator
MVSVVLADDHAIVRQGLRTLLECDPLLEVVGEASDGREAIELVKRRRPSIVIADLMMPGVNGLQFTSRVSRLKLGTRVIVLSMYQDDAYVLEAFKNGAAGYVAKESGGAELFQAIQETLAGRRYLSPVIAEASGGSYAFQGSTLLRQLRPASRDPHDTLTARERSVLRLVVDGASKRDIANHLTLGVRAVDGHIASLIRKLGLKTSAELTRYALQRGVALGRQPASTATLKAKPIASAKKPGRRRVAAKVAR